jgi:hypothetical protein
VRGPDWRPFLQNLLTNDVENLPVGEARFTALLTPQGRLLYDLFVVAADEDTAWLDVHAGWRDALIQKLQMYRLRAKVEISQLNLPISAHPREGGDPSDLSNPSASDRSDAALGSPPSRGQSGVRVADPRLPALGWRGYGVEGTQPEAAYDTLRLALGVPGPADWGTDKTYPIEANFDLFNGIDFKKGCFIGQETTSRMHRRGQVKSRMLPIFFKGPPPPFGAEILNGDRRAGEVLSGQEGRAMALIRLDRVGDGDLKVNGRPTPIDWQRRVPPAT